MRLRLIVLVIILLGGISAKCGVFGENQDRLVKMVSLDTQISVAAISPKGELVATVDRTSTSSGNYPIKVWQVEDGRLRYATDEYSVYSLTFSSDGSMLAAACADGVRLLRIADGQLLRTFAGNQLFAVAFSPDSQSLVAGGAEGEVLMWRVNDGTLLNKFELDKHITSVAFSPNKSLLTAGTASNIGFVDPKEAHQGNNPIALWRLSDRKTLAPLAGHRFGVLSLTFDSQGQTLATAGSDGVLKLWRLRDGEMINNAQLASSQIPIHAVSFAPDGQTLAFGVDNNILVFSSSGAAQQHALKGHTKPILRLQYSDDGKTLLSVSEDNTIRIWRLQ